MPEWDGEERRSEDMYFKVCRGEFSALHTSLEQMRDALLSKIDGLAADQNETKLDVRSIKQQLKDYNNLQGKLTDTTEMARAAEEYIAADKKRKEREERESGEKKMHIWKAVASGIIGPILASLMATMLFLFTYGRKMMDMGGK